MTIRAAAAALCAVVALAGCSSDPEPQPLPPIETSSPSPVALPLPSEAAADTPEGAAAFARYYLALMNKAFPEADATPVREVSDPGCGGCNNLIGAIEEPPAAGERVEGGEYVVDFAEAPPVEGGDVIVELRYSLTEVRVYGPDGRLLRRKDPVEDVDAQMRLLRRGASWVVAGFRNVDN
jgi:hypothetical protein